MPQLVEQDQGRWSLNGRLTFQTVPALLPACKDFIKGGTIKLDLGQVELADSAGLALLVEWTVYAKQQGVNFCLTSLPVQILAMARVSGVDEILPIQAH